MPTPNQPKTSRNSAILLVVLFVAAAYAAYTGFSRSIWVIPAEAKLLKNPFPADEATAKFILPVYLDKCSECHGESGKGNGPQAKMYDPGPSNLTDTQHLRAVTDGELFYVITEGHKPMPTFKKKLTEDQRWQLVLLVRSFSKTMPASPNK